MLVSLVLFIPRLRVAAYVMLGYWFLLQLLGGAAALGQESGGVAFAAHVGGFVAGALLVGVFKDRELVMQHRALARTM
jgi:membrane associated rhomboid family serine protease